MTYRDTCTCFYSNNEKIAISRGSTIELHNFELNLLEKKVVLPSSVLCMELFEENDKTEFYGLLSNGSTFVYNLFADKIKTNEVVGKNIHLVSGHVFDNCVAAVDVSGTVSIVDIRAKKVVSSMSSQEEFASILGVELLKNGLVLIRTANEVHVRNTTKKGELLKSIKVDCGITCASFDPISERLVIGDVLGRLHTISDLFKPRHRTQVNHWHSSAVGAVGFLPGGTTVITGGNEGVLVFWKDEMSRKDFCPRLDGPILKITTDQSGEYACAIFENHRLRVIRTANYQSVFVQSSLYTRDLNSSKVVDFRGKQ